MKSAAEPSVMRGVSAALTSLSDGLVVVERVVSRAMVLGFVGLITLNVGMRYLAGRPIVFAEEMAAILLVWLAFVAISISVHDRTQVGVTILTDRLRKRAQRALEVAVSVVIVGLLGVLLWKSFVWVQSPAVSFEQVITTGWPKWPFFIVVPVFCLTTLTHVMAHIARPTGEHHEVTI